MEWVLMSARALTEKNRSKVAEVTKYWKGSTVYVCTTASGTVRFCTSCGDLSDATVGSTRSWLNDTGNGYRHVPWNERILTIRNVVRFDADGNMKAENNFGLDVSAPIYVFK